MEITWPAKAKILSGPVNFWSRTNIPSLFQTDVKKYVMCTSAGKGLDCRKKDQSCYLLHTKNFVVVQLQSHVQLFPTPWTIVHQAPLSSTIFWSLLNLMSIEQVMLSNHLTLCHLLLLLPSIFPSTRIFSNEQALHIRWPK